MPSLPSGHPGSGDTDPGLAPATAAPVMAAPVLAAPATAAEVSARLREIYGQDPARSTGVTHIVAAARGPDARLHALRIGPHAPKSDTDFFLLQAVRARVAAVLTSSANLRAEPGLVHDFVGESRGALADYRRQVANKQQPLEVFVLTQSGDLPPQHPIWSDSARKHVLTERAAAARVLKCVPSDVIVHQIDQLDLRAAVAFVRGLGHAAISIEAGPTLLRAAYHERSVVDELCLSLYLGAELMPAALGGALPPDDVLFARRAIAAPPVVREGWSFQRYL